MTLVPAWGLGLGILVFAKQLHGLPLQGCPPSRQGWAGLTYVAASSQLGLCQSSRNPLAHGAGARMGWSSHCWSCSGLRKDSWSLPGDLKRRHGLDPATRLGACLRMEASGGSRVVCREAGLWCHQWSSCIKLCFGFFPLKTSVAWIFCQAPTEKES